jgi:hypothetical protein
MLDALVMILGNTDFMDWVKNTISNLRGVKSNNGESTSPRTKQTNSFILKNEEPQNPPITKSPGIKKATSIVISISEEPLNPPVTSSWMMDRKIIPNNSEKYTPTSDLSHHCCENGKLKISMEEIHLSSSSASIGQSTT